MKKRILSLLCLLALCACALPSAAESSAPYVMMGLELDSSGRSWADSVFFQLAEERTGIRFTFREYTDKAQYRTVLAECFASGDLPDVLFKAGLTRQDEIRWLESGQLVDLAPLLAENAPTFRSILDARPDWEAVVTQPNGAVASLPSLSGAPLQCCIWINRAWLNTLGLAMPSTLEEFETVLAAFRDNDPNGNSRRDEIPFSLVGSWEAKYLLSAFGITADDYNLCLRADGSLGYAPFEPGYRDFVAWLRYALEAGLVDPSAFRDTAVTRSSKIGDTSKDNPTNLVGVLVSYAPFAIVDTDFTDQYAALAPLNGGSYRRLFTGVTGGTFAVTSACDDPAAMLAWADYLYTEEGGRLAYAGRAGVDYVIDDNGLWKWVGEDDYFTLSDIAKNSIISSDSRTPGLEPAAFLRNSGVAYDVYARRQVDQIRDSFVEVYPPLWPTDAQREERIAELQAQLGPIVDTAIAEFAMGIRPLDDENWNAFLQTLRDGGAEELLQLFRDKLAE